MMPLRLATLTALTALLLAACSGRSTGDDATTDTAEPDVLVFDAIDPEVAPDAPRDVAPPDAAPDASPHDAAPETTPPADAADLPEADLGTPDTETTTPDDAAALDETEPDVEGPNDATTDEASGSDAPPSEIDDADAATETDTDPGPVGDNVLAEGSFELWADGLPVGWVGTATNLGADAISEVTDLAHDGVRACRLTNPGDGHKRFTTAPFALLAGDYACRYWVQGGGEIRNGRYDGDYSTYSGYTTVSGSAWQPVDYSFHLAADVAAFELIFSVRATAADGLVLDDVRCVRAPEACDTVTCEPWQVCQGPDGTCATAPGKCAADADCAPWQACDADHVCVLATGACTSTADCQEPTPVCDLEAHLCVAGDPCADVACNEWQVCEPQGGTCVTAEGRCVGLADCDQALPVCDLATHTCVAVDGPVNVVPNGGFEDWSTVVLGTSTEFLLPDHWYGLCDGCSPYYPTTEIDAHNVKPYTTAPHGGTTALQLIEPSTPADRFVSEPFPVTPGESYACAYWVRGHGTFRQRGYCGAWNPDTDYQAIDSDTWQQVTFTLGGNASWCVLILYASNTVADRDHVQFDDVVCIK
jgi:hypothetical protein